MLKILHRWVALLIGIGLVVTSLSGAWLIYHREWREPDFVLEIKPQTIALERLYTIALKELNAVDGMVIRFPQKPEFPYQFWSMGDDHQRLFINQYSGEVLAKHAPDYWPYGWIFELHTAFLADQQGENVLGIIGVVALFLTITGIILWWPKRKVRLAQHLRLRLYKGRYVRHFDLHRHLGILAAPLFILIFITGVVLVFNSGFSQLVNQLTNAKPVKVSNSHDATRAPRINLDIVLDVADRAITGGRVGIVIVPPGNKPMVVRKQMPDDPHPNGLNFIHIDAVTGKLLQAIPVSQADTARRLFNWIYPIHTGQVLGTWYGWLLLVLGLIPAGLLFTAMTTFIMRTQHRIRSNIL